MPLIMYAPRPRNGLLSKLELELASEKTDEPIALAQHLSSPEIIIKPKELHLAFKWGPLNSTHFSRFRKLKLPPSRRRYEDSAANMPLPRGISRSSTICSVRSFTTLSRTVTLDVGLLITRPIRREGTYIVWGGVMAPEAPSSHFTTPRNVLVKIAVDEEGGEDLREDARLHEQLVERGMTVGYYGIFVDSIGSTALVIDDWDNEVGEVHSPTPSTP
ncbi:hypothetical protein GSI_14008 [Ganoderma sinense ZZ0214-1]|uniref:Uncharacterized protein n=1 Tax=Ganoderma sinense ZZ0214-1 TaxID=1077348 RepID=A0A2G8RRW7_9APHY|nr:hypothetical protein GSI_14008 [Ganoderma sinense ZZ0214-1]